ncbi:MAG: hypothetical protein JOZ19_15255, partial [Rubrobacter sp.]|nr:hypothetical protein [Rubrobacter sp.]
MNGRVVREYFGAGLLGVLAARIDAEERRRREEEAKALKEAKEQLNALEEPLVELCEATEILARAALLSSGYRRYKRGEWRKKRVEVPKTTKKDQDRPAQHPPSGEELEEEHRKSALEKLRKLAKMAEEGDEKAVSAIRKTLEEHPGLAKHWADFAKVTESVLIRQLANDNPVIEEVFKHQFAAMREEVAGEDPSPLERLLAERVVATWLEVQLLQNSCTSNIRGSLATSEAEYYQRHLDRAHKRHLSAIRTL